MASNADAVQKPFVKEYQNTVPVLLRVLDAAALCAAGWLVYYLWHGNVLFDLQYKVTVTIGALISLIFFELSNIYRPRRSGNIAGQIWLTLQATTATMIVLVVMLKLWIPEFPVDANFKLVMLWGLISFFSIALTRIVVSATLNWHRDKGWNRNRVIIVGLSEMALTASERVNMSALAGLQVIGYVDDRPMPRFDDWDDSIPRLGSVADLPHIVEREEVTQVWVCYPLRGEARTREVVDTLRHSTVSIRLVIDCYAFQMASRLASMNDIAGIPTLDISVSALDGINWYIKEFEDRFFALIALTILSPLMLAIAVGVKLSSPGPVFYRQERIGWNNRPFGMLKFRSMPVDAEAKTGPVWAKPNENRATPFGAFLRKTSLDELPQLINVLKGEMSLVGPRPERPAFVDKFKDQIPNYMKKHMVKAGITGWAQVNGWRGDTDLKTRIEYDLYYIHNWSIWLDLVIAVRTVVSGMVNKNAY